jgi:hypothetical protein
MFEDLLEKCVAMHEAFDSLDGLELSGHERSPVKHLRLVESRRRDRESDKKLLRNIVQEVGHGQGDQGPML